MVLVVINPPPTPRDASIFSFAPISRHHSSARWLLLFAENWQLLHNADAMFYESRPNVSEFMLLGSGMLWLRKALLVYLSAMQKISSVLFL
jgi:hypothetical protein